MKRRKPIPRKRSTPRRSSRVRDPQWLAEVRRLPCCICGRPGPNDPDHVGARGLGQKCSDRETIPLCRKHHDERTDRRGYFDRYTREDMRAWCAARLAETQTTVTAVLAGVGGVSW